MNNALQVSKLLFSYTRPGETPWTLSVDGLSLQRGDQLLLTASSGHGKSTLLSLIAGLMEPQSGTISIDGTPMHSLKGARRDQFRGSKIGMIFQTFNLLLGFSALENVMAAMMFTPSPPAQQRTKATEALSLLGITRINADVSTLSLGQQQRVAVARAVVCDPVIVLADEPTASLDPENAAIAIDLIQSTCQKKNAALLCVSHDPAIWTKFSRRQRLDSFAIGGLTAAPAAETSAALLS